MSSFTKKRVRYERALVTYLDILGFRDLVERNSAGKISKTLRLVREAVKPESKVAKTFRMLYQSFSSL